MKKKQRERDYSHLSVSEEGIEELPKSLTHDGKQNTWRREKEKLDLFLSFFSLCVCVGVEVIVNFTNSSTNKKEKSAELWFDGSIGVDRYLERETTTRVMCERKK